MLPAAMELSVLLMVSLNMREEWRSAITTIGEQFVETLGLKMKPVWFVESWDTSLLVKSCTQQLMLLLIQC